MYLFIGKYIQFFAQLEAEIDDSIILFFNAKDNMQDLFSAALKKGETPTKKHNEKIETLLKHFLISTEFGFRNKLELYKTILQLLNTKLYKQIEKQKPNSFFDLLNNLMEFRNVIAHNHIFYLDEKDNYFTLTKKGGKAKSYPPKFMDENSIAKKKEFYFSPSCKISKIDKKGTEFILQQLAIAFAILRTINNTYSKLNKGLIEKDDEVEEKEINDTFQYYSLHKVFNDEGVFIFHLTDGQIQAKKDAIIKEKEKLRKRAIQKKKERENIAKKELSIKSIEKR
jgi:hypothetical protein